LSNAIVYMGRRGGGPSFTYALFMSNPNFQEVVISEGNELADQYSLDFAGKVLTFDLPHRYADVFKIIHLFRMLWVCLIRYKEITISHHSPVLLLFIFITPFVKISYVMHDVVPHNGEKFQRFTHFLLSIFFHQVFVLSEYQRSLYPFARKKRLRKLLHPLYLHYHSKNLTKLSCDIAPCRFLMFGRIEPYKGLQLIEKINSIATQHVLNVVGTGTVELNNNENVGCRIYNQYIPDTMVPSLLDTCEYLILPHTQATQSGLFPLAATFNKKVICFDIPVFREQSKDHKVQTIFVPYNDFSQFGKTIEELSTK
jgi:hypothetical protein